MTKVLIIHEVADYAAWKKIFDAAREMRKRAGEIAYELLRYDDDARMIVHFSRWSSHADARRFFASPELADLRIRAGVKAPQFIYLDEIESGILE